MLLVPSWFVFVCWPWPVDYRQPEEQELPSLSLQPRVITSLPDGMRTILYHKKLHYYWTEQRCFCCCYCCFCHLHRIPSSFFVVESSSFCCSFVVMVKSWMTTTAVVVGPCLLLAERERCCWSHHRGSCSQPSSRLRNLVEAPEKSRTSEQPERQQLQQEQRIQSMERVLPVQPS